MMNPSQTTHPNNSRPLKQSIMKNMSSTQNSFFSKATSKQATNLIFGSTLLMGKSVSNRELRKRMTDFLEKHLQSKLQKGRHQAKKMSTESSESPKSKGAFSKTTTNGFFKVAEKQKKTKTDIFLPLKTTFEKESKGKFSQTFTNTFNASGSSLKFSINIENLRNLTRKIQNSRTQKGRGPENIQIQPRNFISKLGKPSIASTTDSSPSHNDELYYIGPLSKACQEKNPGYTDLLFSDHLYQALQAAKFSEFVDCEADEILFQVEEKRVNLPPSKFAKTIIFDLDETLIHCNDSEGDNGDADIKVNFPNGENFEVFSILT